jgi:hypothetical protein
MPKVTCYITERQFQLQEREERNLRELATLEERIAASVPGQDMVMVARLAHEATSVTGDEKAEGREYVAEGRSAVGLGDGTFRGVASAVSREDR